MSSYSITSLEIEVFGEWGGEMNHFNPQQGLPFSGTEPEPESETKNNEVGGHNRLDDHHPLMENLQD